MNTGKWLRRNGKAEIRRTFRRPAKIYFGRKIMLVCESLEMMLDPRNTPFRNPGKMPLA